jgi:Tfp pilus assembly protein FimT
VIRTKALIFKPFRNFPANARRGRGGYSLIEMLLTIMLVQFIGALVSVQVSSATAVERGDYAGQELITALRYARQLALTKGTPCGVILDDTNQKFSVFQTTTSNIVNNSAIGGPYTVNFKTQSNCLGTTFNSITLSGGGKIVTYGKIGATSNLPRGLGSTTNNGIIILKCGTATHTINIPEAGEPTLQ